MPSPFAVETTRRARPLLGTLVSISVDGAGERNALTMIDAAFAEIATVHEAMSFHVFASDVARLNRQASTRAVSVDKRTIEVLLAAIELSQASDGAFDVTVAAQLVGSGVLPLPVDAPSPDPQANWRDIKVGDEDVRFQRPLWIDLGGIAKGYAVDRALAVLKSAGARQACVNAGGDIGVFGDQSEPVMLRALKLGEAPIIELSNAALASSVASEGTHFDGARRAAARGCAFATVVADRCMLADALTKIALVGASECSAIMSQFGATAYICDKYWQTIGVKS